MANNQWEMKMERLEAMQLRITTIPMLLNNNAGNNSCCIFRIPETLLHVSGSVYKPQLVSIGPYHHGSLQLQMIEEHKWRLLGTLLNRTQPQLQRTLEDFLRAIQPLEARVRECYSEVINLDTHEFLEMLVLDGCFIIELFRKFSRVVSGQSDDDPLLSVSWVKSLFFRDLIRIENQIPFFVLQKLFNITRMPHEEFGPSLNDLTLTFFNWVLRRPNPVGRFTGKHLLDFVRSTFIPPQLENPQNRQLARAHLIPCISMLRQAGIKLRPEESESFLAVKFRDRVIRMPKILIGDFMRCFMANCVAFEQCHKHCTKHFTTYASLLDCLINTSKDVEFLSDQNILENYLEDNVEVAKYINNLGKDVLFDINNCYLTNLFIGVNNHYKSKWNVQWANFIHTYFSSPWSPISVIAAFILLGLTALQTYYAVKGGLIKPKTP